MVNDNVLVESKKAREKMLANERSLHVLDKVKELTYLKNNTYVTINQVISYYEVSKRTIERLIHESREEIESDGLKIVEKGELKEIKGYAKGVGSLYDEIKYSKKLTLFTRRAVLRIGMMLRDSEVAKTVRNYLLNIESISTEEQKEWAIQRALGKQKRRQLTDALKESGEDERMKGFAYPTYTNMIYKLVLGMKAKKYKQMNNIDGNLRDNLNGKQLNLIKTLEDIAKAQLDLVFEYGEVKEIIQINYKRYEDKILSK